MIFVVGVVVLSTKRSSRGSVTFLKQNAEKHIEKTSLKTE